MNDTSATATAAATGQSANPQIIVAGHSEVSYTTNNMGAKGIQITESRTGSDLRLSANELNINVLNVAPDGKITAALPNNSAPVLFEDGNQLRKYAVSRIASAFPEYETMKLTGGVITAVTKIGQTVELDANAVRYRLNQLKQHDVAAAHQAENAPKQQATAPAVAPTNHIATPPAGTVTLSGGEPSPVQLNEETRIANQTPGAAISGILKA